MKKIGRIAIIISWVITIWIVVSFIEINHYNNDEHEYSGYSKINYFNLIDGN